GVGCVGLLRRDDAASGPLLASVRARKGHRANHAVAVDYGSPHFQAEPAVLLALGLRQGEPQGRVAWKAAADIDTEVRVVVRAAWIVGERCRSGAQGGVRAEQDGE